MPVTFSPELLIAVTAVLFTLGIAMFVIGRILRLLLSVAIVAIVVWLVLAKGPELKRSWCRNLPARTSGLITSVCR